MGRVIQINFDDLLFKLLCWYAFLIPFEKVLEVLFDIETIFKPYRIFALLIIVTFGIKCFHRWNSNPELKTDIFLYLIFAYGLMLSAFKMITVRFSTALFYNDIFQMGLYLAVFVVIRHTRFSMEKLLKISKYLGLGILINAIYIFYNFFILKNFIRDSGFMDNPNYLALGVVILVLLVIALRPQLKSNYQKIGWWILLGFLGYIFIIAGSRTGIVVMILSAFVLVSVSSGLEKKIILILSIAVSVLLGARQMYNSNDIGPLILLNRIAEKKSSDDPRIPMWSGIIKASQETNFVGLGIGQFKANFHRFYYQENNDLIKRIINRGYFLSPHSDYFALLIIYGIFGLVCYLIFMFLTGKRILNGYFQAENEKQKMYFRYSVSIFLTLVIFGAAAESFNSSLFWLILSVSSKTHFSLT